MNLFHWACLFILSLAMNCHATSATWVGGHASNDLNTPANWSGDAVPDDDAVFIESTPSTSTPTLELGNSYTVNRFLFSKNENASPFQFTISAPNSFTSVMSLFGIGVQVDSNKLQTFTINNNGQLWFYNSSNAFAGQGDIAPIYYVNDSAGTGVPGSLYFYNQSTAGGARIYNNGATVYFYKESTAANSWISTFNGGTTQFYANSSAGSSYLYGDDCEINFDDHSTAASATIHASNGTYIQALSSDVDLASATFIAEKNSFVSISDCNPVSLARMKLFTGSQLGLYGNDLSIATLQGDLSSSVDLQGHNLQVGNGGFSSAYYGAIITGISGGSFEKIGNGTFIFNGSGNYNGATNVREGTYVLNGSLTNSPVNVLNGATLEGTGSIVNSSLIIHGTLSPGNSVGTLSVINGPATFAGGSRYIAEVDGSGESDLLDVIGVTSSVAIDLDSLLSITSTDHTAIVGPNHRYRIIHADDGVTGRFTNIIQRISAFLVPHVIYRPNDVYLSFTTNFSASAATCNEKCVAALFDRLAAGEPTVEQSELLTALGSLQTVEALQNGLNLLTGEQYTHLDPLSSYTDYRFSRRLFSSIRYLITPCGRCNSSEAWVRAEYDHARVQNGCDALGLYDNSWDLSFGVHKSVGSNAVFGVAGNFGEDFAHFERGNTTNKFKTGQGALYGLYQSPYAFLFSNLILGTTWKNGFTRSLDIGSFNGTTCSDARIFHGKWYIEAGKAFEVCQNIVEPFFGVDAGWCLRRSINECGFSAATLSIESQTKPYGDTYLGFHLLRCLCSSLDLSGDLYWQHRFGSFGDNINVTHNGTCDICCVTGQNWGRNAVAGTLNAAYNWCNWTLYAEFEGQYWNHFRSVGCTVGAGYRW